MENTSEDEYLDELNQNPPSKKTKFGIEETDFVKCLQSYPCLLDKSQTPEMKAKKRVAVEALGKNIKKNHGVSLSTSQIKKKIENMKARVISKSNKQKTGILKEHEKQLLALMDHKNNPVLNKIRGSEKCRDEHVEFKGEEIPAPSSRIPQFRPVSTPKSSQNKCSVIDLQKEVLLQQRELNKQQKELNIQEKEIFVLQKEKLLLEIELLNKKLY